MVSAGAGPLVIGSPDDARLRTRWTALAAAAKNIFVTPEWTELWWRHFGAGSELRLSSVPDAEGETIAVLALAGERRGPFSIARFAGHGVADELGPACAPRDCRIAAAALAGAADGHDVFVAERLRDDWAHDALAGTVLRVEESPAISLQREGGWEPYLAARSSNFRQQVRRRARNVQRGLGLSYRLADDPARLDADFATLVALHRARWGRGSSAFDGARETFHRQFAALALQRGWLRLWLAEAQGAPVAAWYGFRFAGVECYYQSGRDPAWDRHAVGAAILEHSIREAFADGLDEYRLLRGDERYKRRYATSLDKVVTVAVGQTPRGRALVAGVRALARRRRGRRLVRALAG